MLGLHLSFFDAMAKLSSKTTRKVGNFLGKFMENPHSKGINIEKIAQWRDKTLRSVRIDRTYRGVIKYLSSNDSYIMLWVDRHEEAYRWGETHGAGGSEGDIVVEPNGSGEVKEKPNNPSQENLFTTVRDRYLLRLGVVKEMIPLIRGVSAMAELAEIKDRLPSITYEALYFLADGTSLDEVMDEYGNYGGDSEEVSPDMPPSSDVVIIQTEEELKIIFDGPLEKWRVFLHPEQRKLVECKTNGPMRVLGGAGTGKTVVAMHRAKYLAEKIFKGEHDKILFTTFTKNLTADIKKNLATICSTETMEKIEVVNIDHWVSHYLQKNNYPYSIAYGACTESVWQKALKFAPKGLDLGKSFYKEEWGSIIQPQQITSLIEYIKVSRVGRGVRLSRSDREKVWPVFSGYQDLLQQNDLKEIGDAMHDAYAMIQKNVNIPSYCGVIVDEAQDMSPQALKLIREIAGPQRSNDLFIVGDAHQRIYGHKAVFGHCGIKILGRGKKLHINYRTTEENRLWATNILKGIEFDDMDGGYDNHENCKSLVRGPVPEVRNFNSMCDEVKYIADYIGNVIFDGGKISGICLVARTITLLKSYESKLHDAGVETYQLSSNECEDCNRSGLRLATMHRVKGLEFDRMIIVGMNDGVMPLRILLKHINDKVVLRNLVNQERSLLYVAATRAKREVLVTSNGVMSRFLG